MARCGRAIEIIIIIMEMTDIIEIMDVIIWETIVYITEKRYKNYHYKIIIIYIINQLSVVYIYIITHNIHIILLQNC